MTQLSRLQKAYREFFTAMLDDYGVKSPAQLGDKKSEFFSKIKKDWAKKKKTMKEGVLRQTIRELVAEELETHKPNITNEAKEVPEHFKKLAKVIIDKKGNFSVKDFEKLGIPFEIFLQMAQVDKNTLVKNAKKLLSQQESKVFNEMEGDEIPGGKGDKTNPNQVDQKELKVGIEVEFEHTNNRKTATEIALDHLAERDTYYSDLIKSGIVDEKEALNLAKKYGWIK